MKKLLYISVNSKLEEDSTSKTVARKLIDKIIKYEDCEVEVEEFDVYKEHIPTLTHEYFCGRNTLCNDEDYEELNHRARNEIDRIKVLANQFKEADIYVVASPMWSLFFPAPFKQYLDCVIQNGITIDISEKKCKGLLDDKERKFYFVQSSGGDIPVLFKGMLDHSSCYLKDIVKFMGIDKYKEILVDGTGFTKEERRDAIEAAEDEIDAMFKIGKAIDKACEDSKEFMDKMKGYHKKLKKEDNSFTYRAKEDKDEEEPKEKENFNEEEEQEHKAEKNNKENESVIKNEPAIKEEEKNHEEIVENDYPADDTKKEPEEELTDEKMQSYEKMESDKVLNEESAKEY